MDFIQNELKEIKKLLLKQQFEQKEIFTLEEASEYLSISMSCIYKMTSGNKITFYSPGGKKKYIRKDDLEAWVYSKKTPSIDELNQEQENYLFKNDNT